MLSEFDRYRPAASGSPAAAPQGNIYPPSHNACMAYIALAVALIYVIGGLQCLLQIARLSSFRGAQCKRKNNFGTSSNVLCPLE